MQPEISHRCESCGVSIREPAMFCPECGRPLSTASGSAAPANREVSQAVDDVPSASPVESVKTLSTASQNQAVADGRTAAPSPSHPSKHPKYDKARDSLHRAGNATREALADNVKRVEKIRQVSTVMFEEASYDPSLRFVLVALALFIIFLALLLLSKVMG